jgi:LmbE family N-acetylglucosaminyl deacetylase
MQKYIYLSPHLDDAVLSCGAVIWDQIRRRQAVEIWTVFAGDPPPGEFSPFARTLHERWQTGPEAVETRRKEDALACERLNAPYIHLAYPDCIYRTFPGTEKPVIEKNEDLFQVPFPQEEFPLVEEIACHLKKEISADTMIVVPLGIGNHIDHQIVRRVGEKLGQPLYYYADFPYSASIGDQDLAAFLPDNAVQHHFPLSNLALSYWQYGVEAYTSQISTFWPSLSEMYARIEQYAVSPIGNSLWNRAS